MSTRFRIASLVYMMTNAVLFGIGVIAIMTIPALARNAMDWVPAAVVASFVIAAPVAWMIAPGFAPDTGAIATATRFLVRRPSVDEPRGWLHAP